MHAANLQGVTDKEAKGASFVIRMSGPNICFLSVIRSHELYGRSFGTHKVCIHVVVCIIFLAPSFGVSMKNFLPYPSGFGCSMLGSKNDVFFDKNIYSSPLLFVR